MKNYIKNYIDNSIKVKSQILNNENLLDNIKKSVDLVITAYKNQNKILIAGNGGSAADSQHIATELVSKFLKERSALNAIALTTNTSILTAIGNDYGNDEIFARQIQAYGQKNDIFIAISTSGNSENIIKAIIEAKNRGLKIIGLSGISNSKIDSLCDVLIKVPSNETPIVQESHIMIGHIICALAEKELF